MLLDCITINKFSAFLFNLTSGGSLEGRGQIIFLSVFQDYLKKIKLIEVTG